MHQLAGFIDVQAGAVSGQAEAQPGRDPRCQFPAVGRGTTKKDGRLATRNDGGQNGTETVGGKVLQQGMNALDDTIGTVMAKCFQSGKAVIADDRGDQFLIEFVRQMPCLGQKLINNPLRPQPATPFFTFGKYHYPAIFRQVLNRGFRMRNRYGMARADVGAGAAKGTVFIHLGTILQNRDRTEGTALFADSAGVAFFTID